jgi:hypothetical protein
MREELFHADGRTDIMKLIVAFRAVAKAPDNASCPFLTGCSVCQFIGDYECYNALASIHISGYEVICLIFKSFITVCWYNSFENTYRVLRFMLYNVKLISDVSSVLLLR